MLEYFFDFSYRRLAPAIEEWFRLMEWLLVISALAFAAEISGNLYLDVFVQLSVLGLWFYSAVVLPERFFRSLAPIPPEQRTKSRIALRVCCVFVCMATIVLLSFRLQAIAREFAGSLATQLN